MKTQVFKEYLSKLHELPRIYIKESIQDIEGHFDHRYGVTHDLELYKFSIGGSVINFDGPHLKIIGIRYRGTPGLYELLIMKNPLGYTEKDEEENMDIMKRTNALYSRSGSAPTIQTRSKAGRRYITLKKMTKNPHEYKYFGDYNEIIDRLRLLIASEAARYNAHNEIISIIEELQEARIIK